MRLGEEKRKKKKKPQGKNTIKNIMSASATQGGHNNSTVIYVILITLSYYLFNIKRTTFNKICSLVTCTGNQIPIVLVAVDRLINEITASNEMPSMLLSYASRAM